MTHKKLTKCFNFSVEVDGKCLPLSEVTLTQDRDGAKLAMKTAVDVGKRPLREIMQNCPDRVDIVTINSDQEEVERVTFITEEFGQYVYGRWDASKTEYLCEELTLIGRVKAPSLEVVSA